MEVTAASQNRVVVPRHGQMLLPGCRARSPRQAGPRCWQARMIDIDGSAHSGTGTVVRHVAAYAALTGPPVRVRNARARRQRPGLRPRTCGRSRRSATWWAGASTEPRRAPGPSSSGRATPNRSAGMHGTSARPADHHAGPVGAAVLAVRGRGAEAEIRGGLFQDFAPSAFHLQHVIVPLLAQLGLAAQIETIRPGYPPAGQGIIGLAVPACEQPLCPLTPRRGQAPARVGDLAGIPPG